MKTFVIGSGGRESAIVWALSKEKIKVFCAPGNPGTLKYGQKVSIKANELDLFLNFAKNERVDLTIVGPEAPLVNGIVDKFRAEGLKIFGPAQAAAEIEGRKSFCKELCKKYNIPTAGFEVFEDFKKAKEYVEAAGAPIVIKADGLASGKGVIVAKTVKEAIAGLETIMLQKAFGSAGERVIVEECLEGKECSFIVITDGDTIVPLALAQDYKRVFDGDGGPNTGGMGSYSPMRGMGDEERIFAFEKIIKPLIAAMASEGRLYCGAFYAGLMLTGSGVKLIEVNCRLGDPETQAIFPRLASSAAEIFLAASEGNLKKADVRWSENCSVCVVLASYGYPGKYQTGFYISGIEKAEKSALVFHAGTRYEDSGIFTDGGRVLNVVGLGKDFRMARSRAYRAARAINFASKYYRRDIAYFGG